MSTTADSSGNVAVIPARGGSKRVPRKNIREVLGRPLIGYPLLAAQASGLFDVVAVSTEDHEIAAIAEDFGARVVMRPAAFATDEINERPAVRHAVETLETEGVSAAFVCVIYPTACLIVAEDLQGARRLFDVRQPAPDSVIGVSAYRIHPYKALVTREDGFLQAVWPEENLKRSQEFPHFVASNGTFYWLAVAAFRQSLAVYTERTAGYEIPKSRAVDIDDEEDLRLAEAMLRVRGPAPGQP